MLYILNRRLICPSIMAVSERDGQSSNVCFATDLAEKILLYKTRVYIYEGLSEPMRMLQCPVKKSLRQYYIDEGLSEPMRRSQSPVKKPLRQYYIDI